MAIDTPSDRPITAFEKAGVIVFFGALAMYYFVSEKAGARAFGVWLVLFAIAMHKNGGIEFGISGRPGTRRLTGPLAAILNALVALLGVVVVIWPEIPIKLLGWDAR